MVEIKVTRNYRDLQLNADKKIGEYIIVTDERANKLIELELCEFVRDIVEEKPIAKAEEKPTVKPTVKPLKAKPVAKKKKVAKKGRK